MPPPDAPSARTFPPRQLSAKIRDVQADLTREAVKPRPGRAAPRATKRSATGYRTLQPDEPATTKVSHTVKLQLFPEDQRPIPDLVQLTAPDKTSPTRRQMISAA